MVHALIIDDNRMNIDVMKMLLTNQGVAFTAVESPRLGLEALAKTGAVDVVFLDLEFPNDDGMDYLDTFKNDPRLAGVPIVAYTVHTSEIDVARKAGFHGFLGKPLSAQRFPEQLQRILAGQSVWEV